MSGIVAVQNPESSRNLTDAQLEYAAIVAVQNPESSRNRIAPLSPIARNCSCSKSGVQPQRNGALIVSRHIVAVQNPESSRNKQCRLIASDPIVAVQNPESSRN